MKYDKWYNGIGKGIKDQAGFYSLVNCDVHSIPGAVTCSKALAKISATTNTQKCEISAKLPNGDTFWANKSDGKIWKEHAGTVSLVHTNGQGANFGMEYSKGYLYYISATKLGRIAETNASSEATWSSHNDSWGTFTNTNDHVIKCAEVRGKLLIPNKNLVAMVSHLGAFVANSLDLQDQHSITTIMAVGIYALIGTRVDDNFNLAGIFVWDTINPTWLLEDYVEEDGVNMFINGDNDKYIQIGVIGNIYKWNGQQAVLWGRLRNAGNITTALNPYGSASLNGLPLISTNQGVYSLGRADAEFPIAQVIEYSPSVAGAECGAIETVGNDVLLAWKSGSTYGLDKTGTGYATAVIKTPESQGTLNNLYVYYDSLPGASTITARVSRDGGSFGSHSLEKDDQILDRFISGEHITSKRRCQSEVTLTPDGANVPIIDSIELN